MVRDSVYLYSPFSQIRNLPKLSGAANYHVVFMDLLKIESRNQLKIHRRLSDSLHGVCRLLDDAHVSYILRARGVKQDKQQQRDRMRHNIKQRDLFSIAHLLLMTINQLYEVLPSMPHTVPA